MRLCDKMMLFILKGLKANLDDGIAMLASAFRICDVFKARDRRFGFDEAETRNRFQKHRILFETSKEGKRRKGDATFWSWSEDLDWCLENILSGSTWKSTKEIHCPFFKPKYEIQTI